MASRGPFLCPERFGVFLPRKVVDAPSLEAIKARLDMTLGSLV